MAELTPEERQRIYEEEKARLDGEQSQPPAAKPLPARKVLISALVTVVLLAGIGKFAFEQYRIHDLRQKLGEAIGRDQGLTETILGVESESPNITYAEVFELCNKSLESRTNLIVELRGLYPEMDYRMKTRLVEYLSAENEFVRAKRDLYRKSMELSSAADLFFRDTKDLPSSTYGMAAFHARFYQLEAKADEAAREAGASADEFLRLYEKTAKEERVIASEAKKAGVRFEPVFEKHAKANQKKVEETKWSARRFQN